MKVYYSSDLHLEFFKSKGKTKDSANVLADMYKGISGDVLVLAGDIHVHSIYPIYMLLELVINMVDFKHIIYVTGNHEYYNDNFYDVNEELNDFDVPGVHILNPGAVTIGDVSFIGGTLWTDFNNGNPKDMVFAQQAMNDFACIAGQDGFEITPNDFFEVHEEHKEYIRSALAKTTGKAVVVTHHGPSYKSVPREFVGSELNSAYVSHLDGFIETYQPDYWIHGHTHNTREYKIGETQVLVNPYGYHKLQPNWQFHVNKHFEV